MLIMFYHSFFNIFYFLARIDRACYCPQGSLCMNVNIYSQGLKRNTWRRKLFNMYEVRYLLNTAFEVILKES